MTAIEQLAKMAAATAAPQSALDPLRVLAVTGVLLEKQAVRLPFGQLFRQGAGAVGRGARTLATAPLRRPRLALAGGTALGAGAAGYGTLGPHAAEEAEMSPTRSWWNMRQHFTPTPTDYQAYERATARLQQEPRLAQLQQQMAAARAAGNDAEWQRLQDQYQGVGGQYRRWASEALQRRQQAYDTRLGGASGISDRLAALRQRLTTAVLPTERTDLDKQIMAVLQQQGLPAGAESTEAAEIRRAMERAGMPVRRPTVAPPRPPAGYYNPTQLLYPSLSSAAQREPNPFDQLLSTGQRPVVG